MWTSFYDMFSGGRRKIKDYDVIYIELPEEQAIEYFKSVFGRYPYNVTCCCCGEDFSVDESESFEDFSISARKKSLIIQENKLDTFKVLWNPYE